MDKKSYINQKVLQKSKSLNINQKVLQKSNNLGERHE
jgi:hypothetical protein